MSYQDKLKQMRTKRMMESCDISITELESIVSHTSYQASAKNIMPLRYVLINDKSLVSDIFNITNLVTMHNIDDTNKPSAFILIGTEEEYSLKSDLILGMDIGISYQIIREAIYEMGYNDICIFSFDKQKILKILDLNTFKPCLLVAIGKSKMPVNLDLTNKTRMYFDEDNQYHLNKLDLETMIIKRNK